MERSKGELKKRARLILVSFFHRHAWVTSIAMSTVFLAPSCSDAYPM
jgi:hypothetical protein